MSERNLEIRAEDAEAEVERLTRELDEAQRIAHDEAQAYADQEAEVERLRAALRDGRDCVDAYHGDPDDEEECAVCVWLRVADAVLAGGVGDTAA